ncbi:MAG: hypothetical protein ABI643_03365 [Candidatus Doudnabacteria bacterium]
MESTNQFDTSPHSNSFVIQIIVSVVLTAIIVGGGVYWWTNQKQIEVKTQSNNQAIGTGTGVKDVHHWNIQPIEVKDLNLAKGLFGMPDGYVKAWDAGTYADGYGIQSQLNGARIVLVAFRDPAHDQGPFGTEPTGACDSLARIFIFKAPSGNSFVVYDERYSTTDIVAGGIGFISKDSFPVNSAAQFYYQKGGNAVIPSLDFPGFVVHDRQIFVLQKSSFPCYIVDAQGKTKIFFEDIKSSLESSFTDPVLGTAYTDKSEGGIVFRASDGTYIRYRPL